jgi:hypothetical protein
VQRDPRERGLRRHALGVGRNNPYSSSATASGTVALTGLRVESIAIGARRAGRLPIEQALLRQVQNDRILAPDRLENLK